MMWSNGATPQDPCTDTTCGPLVRDAQYAESYCAKHNEWREPPSAERPDRPVLLLTEYARPDEPHLAAAERAFNDGYRLTTGDADDEDLIPVEALREFQRLRLVLRQPTPCATCAAAGLRCGSSYDLYLQVTGGIWRLGGFSGLPFPRRGQHVTVPDSGTGGSRQTWEGETRAEYVARATAQVRLRNFLEEIARGTAPGSADPLAAADRDEEEAAAQGQAGDFESQRWYETTAAAYRAAARAGMGPTAP